MKKIILVISFMIISLFSFSSCTNTQANSNQDSAIVENIYDYNFKTQDSIIIINNEIKKNVTLNKEILTNIIICWSQNYKHNDKNNEKYVFKQFPENYDIDEILTAWNQKIIVSRGKNCSLHLNIENNRKFYSSEDLMKGINIYEFDIPENEVEELIELIK